MTYYRFNDSDIIDTHIAAYPSYTVENNGNQITGSIFLENSSPHNPLFSRVFQGYSEKHGGKTDRTSPFSGSIELLTAISGGTNEQIYNSIVNLYNHYSAYDTTYAPEFTSSTSTTFRVFSIPEMYYDREVLSSSFTASDNDSAGALREIYDNGRGGLYSGSLTGTLVGHIFYPEGIAVLTKGDLSDFGSASSTNFLWRVYLKGTHQIPVKIFRCRARAGELNASTNNTFFTVPSGSGDYKNEKVKINALTGSQFTYISQVGLFNEDYELVAVANVTQGIKKELGTNILFKIRMDF